MKIKSGHRPDIWHSKPIFNFQFSIFNFILAVSSGLLLTGAFPKTGIAGFAWFAIVPLLLALKNVSLKDGFRLGFVTGLVHYLTLTYWLAYTMKTYGGLPLYVSVPVLFLFSAYLALYVAVFSTGIIRLFSKPVAGFTLIPVLWVSLEYVRSFLFSGFPWELMGYSQFNNLYLIQISDILGVYGVSFLIILSNSSIFLIFLCLTGKEWQGMTISKRVAAISAFTFVFVFSVVWSYGKYRVSSVDEMISDAPSARVTIVQGNIDQAKKWDPEFRMETIQKYIDLSFSARKDNPDLVVWPETATPFYFLYNVKLTEMVLKGMQKTGAGFLIGSPSFMHKNHTEYYNSVYLINPDGTISGQYDKTHLVPFGEYVPLKKWLPFLGKIVEHVGDFTQGKEGNTIPFDNYSLGLQICYEIIFPNLSRMMAKNNAGLLINITNDAWYGNTSAPYQHFSMTIFRAVENKRSLIRSANTGISGFADPAGRVISTTPLFEDAVMTCSVPVLNQKTFYTCFGDLFAMICLVITLLVSVFQFPISKISEWLRRRKIFLK
ncbi:apolipoprotein N-acyltransferase [Desulfonema magnum]|uniref:Apolipoprotein N-acyltransferase n=1 Tax=Desulfonema magnum TaxID=45655 RepID=A0A975BPQ2_9BACT|nr:apolipoprotein N-acyltransferase [Desulfonema magnum]QTA89361.1 Apolipoprotein N-acyltransferase [Desulfonema magnum]